MTNSRSKCKSEDQQLLSHGRSAFSLPVTRMLASPSTTLLDIGRVKAYCGAAVPHTVWVAHSGGKGASRWLGIAKMKAVMRPNNDEG